VATVRLLVLAQYSFNPVLTPLHFVMRLSAVVIFVPPFHSFCHWLLAAAFALACRLRNAFFDRATLGHPVGRQIGLEIKDVLGDTTRWFNIARDSLTCVRDNARNYLLDPRFTRPPVEVNGKNDDKDWRFHALIPTVSKYMGDCPTL
jgi:hypothetical protein